jgi:NAD(P)-dependent dehydrogenase (short-subunit alcohol dehydrogenase family)
LVGKEGKMGGRLQDKVAIITGAGTGIGAAITFAFAREGAHIVGAARRLGKLNEIGEKVKNLSGTKFVAKKCDVMIKNDCQNVAAETIKEFGRIDILVNNASYFPVTRFLSITPEEWDIVLATNLKGYMLMCQAVLPYMVEQKRGKILMINSNQSRLALFHQVHYAVSKGGIIALTRCLSAEFGPKGVYVNGIGCGYTPETEGATRAAVDSIIAKHGVNVSEEVKTKFLSKFDEANISTSALRKVGHVSDYEGIAVYLASDESNFITGQTIMVDGGTSMP